MQLAFVAPGVRRHQRVALKIDNRPSPAVEKRKVNETFEQTIVLKPEDDGPFAETREQLGGYFLMDAKNLDEAIAVAAKIPMARKGTVEVRPVVEIAGLPAE